MLSIALFAPLSADAASYGSRPLKPGMSGHDVSVLQKFLTKLNLPTARTAYFNKSTKRSVMKLEKRQDWKRDGKVSRKQAKKIKNLVARIPKAAGTGNRSNATPSATATHGRACTWNEPSR